MSIINQMLTGQLNLSVEEIEAEIDAVAPEEAEAVVAELSVPEDPMEAESEAAEAEAVAGEEDAGEMMEEAEAVDEVQDAVASMEALIERGNVTGIEFAMIDGYLNRAYGKLGITPATFSAEGFNDAAVRDHELALALEGAKEVMATAKAKIGELKDRFMSLLKKLKDGLVQLCGTKLQRISALRKKLGSIGDTARVEKISLKRGPAAIVNAGNPVTAMEALSKAADFFDGAKMKELADFIGEKTKTKPTVDNAIFSKIPGEPRLDIGEKSITFQVLSVSKKSAELQTLSKSEIAKVLDAAEKAVNNIKRLGLSSLSSFAKFVFITAGYIYVRLTSSYQMLNATNHFFSYLLKVAGDGITLAQRNIAAY